MRVKPKDNLIADLRMCIVDSKKSLDSNKTERKRLMKKIADVKLSMRVGEHYASKMHEAEIDNYYVLNVVQKHSADLMELRHELLTLEAIREVELARFRAMHRQLDKFNIPFDAERKAQANAKRKESNE